jgi:hypothetical protein
MLSIVGIFQLNKPDIELRAPALFGGGPAAVEADVMLAMIYGVVLALSFLGLPLAIIALFIMSIVDQRSPRTGRRDKKITTIRQEIVVRYSEPSAERATTKRRDETVIWRNPSIRREMSAHASGK